MSRPTPSVPTSSEIELIYATIDSPSFDEFARAILRDQYEGSEDALETWFSKLDAALLIGLSIGRGRLVAGSGR